MTITSADIVTAIFVGGQAHGTERQIPGNAPYVIIEKQPAPGDLNGLGYELAQVTYTPRCVIRDIRGERWIQTVWVDTRLREWLTPAQEAVTMAWFRRGQKADTPGHCGIGHYHAKHEVVSPTLGLFTCSGQPVDKEPGRSERRREETQP